MRAIYLVVDLYKNEREFRVYYNDNGQIETTMGLEHFTAQQANMIFSNMK